MTGQRISARIAAVSPSATLAVDAKAKALKAAGRERDRLRGRRARLPDARAHRGGGRGRLPRPQDPQVHPDRRPARAAGGPGRQDPARLGLRGGRLPDPGDQRRQAGHRQLLRRRCATRATRCWCWPPTGPPIPRSSPWPAGCRWSIPTDEASGFRVTVDAARGGPHPADQGAAVRVALQPDRRGLPPSGDRGHRPLGRRARAVGAHRRDLRAPGLRGCRAPLDAGAGPRAGRPLHRGQRRGQDLRHDRLAGRVDDRPDRRGDGGHQPPVPRDLQRGQRLPAGRPGRRVAATSRRWP